ncbi:MAG: preprotein translocase subunit YajC [Alphaproteobacteria bacterium]|nr:preprotein translocase subunit YajC [Alphaproteobacteria bacterium]
MFISPAYAQAAGGGGSLGGLEAMLPLVLIFVVFYFLLIRPQQKKMKAHKAQLSAVRRGDRIVTGGGIIGTVTKVSETDSEIQVEIATGVKVKVQRELISTVLSKTEPQAAKKAANEDGAAKDVSGGNPLKKFFGGKKE